MLRFYDCRADFHFANALCQDVLADCLSFGASCEVGALFAEETLNGGSTNLKSGRIFTSALLIPNAVSGAANFVMGLAPQNRTASVLPT